MPETQPDRPDRPDPLRRSRLPLVALAVLAGAAGVYLFLKRDPAPPPDAREPPAAAAPGSGEPAAPSPPDAAAEAPPPAPATLRERLASLSTAEAFRRWLAEGDAVRRWAVVTDNLAEGASPRRQLAVFAPAGAFSVVADGDALVISPESYRRYDHFADAVAAVDAETAARVYRALRGPLAAAYRALGYPDRSLDRVTARALSRLEQAPVRSRVEVVEDGGTYAFVEEELERASEADKHLLRMGPRNARLVQAKAKEIREALGLEAEARRR
jgi:hypothetical protein